VWYKFSIRISNISFRDMNQGVLKASAVSLDHQTVKVLVTLFVSFLLTNISVCFERNITSFFYTRSSRALEIDFG